MGWVVEVWICLKLFHVPGVLFWLTAMSLTMNDSNLWAYYVYGNFWSQYNNISQLWSHFYFTYKLLTKGGDKTSCYVVVESISLWNYC